MEYGKTAQLKLKVNDDVPLREAVFDTLRQAILDGTLQPGERLMEIHIADQLGVSRTPVREAIRALELEGLVSTNPRRGAVVARIAPGDLQDVLEVRSALEELAVRKACRNMTPERMEKLKTAARAFETYVAAGDLTASAQADEAFHEVISEATGNRRLTQLLEDIRSQVYRYRMENIKNKSSHPELVRSHNLIIEALEKGDEIEAVEAVKDHISRQKMAVIENLHQ